MIFKIVERVDAFSEVLRGLRLLELDEYVAKSLLGLG